MQRYPNRYSATAEGIEEVDGKRLLMEMLHSGGAKDDEEAHPEGGALKGNRFVVFAFLFFILICFENDGVEKQREKAQDENQLDAENPEVLRMVLHALAGLRHEDLIDVMKVDAASEQQDHQQDSRHPLVMLVKSVSDGANIFLGKAGVPKPWLDGHHDEREPPDPDHRREEMEPVIDNRDELVQVKEDALYGIHDRSIRADSEGSVGYQMQCLSPAPSPSLSYRN